MKKNPVYPINNILHKLFLIYAFVSTQFLPIKGVDNEVPNHFKKWNKIICGNLDKENIKKLPNKFRLITWNIERAYQYEKINEILSKFDSEILLLQEVPQKEENTKPYFFDFKNYFSYMPVVFVKNKTKKENFLHFGQLTLSNYCFSSLKAIPFPRVTLYSPFHNGRRYARRAALYTKFFLGENKSLGVYNIHAEAFTKPSGRKKQIMKLLEEINVNNDSHVIIAGDFNSVFGKFEPLYRCLIQEGFKRAHKNGKTCGMFMLDNIFHTSNLEVDTKVDYHNASDHNPIIADIKIISN